MICEEAIMQALKHPLRELVKFLELKPKGVIGWNPDKCTVLDKDLQESIAKELNIKPELAKAIWFGRQEALPEAFLQALTNHKMNKDKVISSYAAWRNENVIKPEQARQAQKEAKQKELQAKQQEAENKRKNNFLEEWK